jgi:hypothetical protein
MAKVKTATRDTGSSVSGTLTLYHAEETYSGRPPVYALGVTAGVQSCGLAVAYWDNDAGVYKYDLSSLGVGGTWELTGESYEEGKRVFVAWIGQAVWAGEDPETKYQNAGVVATALTALQAECDENTCRKDLTPEEAVRVGQRIEAVLRPEAEERRAETQGRPPKTGANFAPVSRDGFGNPIAPPPPPPKTRDAVGASVGMSGESFRKAATVVQAADEDPERFGSLVERMNTTGKVDRAYKAVKQVQKARERAAKAAGTSCCCNARATRTRTLAPMWSGSVSLSWWTSVE